MKPELEAYPVQDPADDRVPLWALVAALPLIAAGLVLAGVMRLGRLGLALVAFGCGWMAHFAAAYAGGFL